jgi:hypothetical protein
MDGESQRTIPLFWGNAGMQKNRQKRKYKQLRCIKPPEISGTQKRGLRVPLTLTVKPNHPFNECRGCGSSKYTHPLFIWGKGSG